MILRGATKTSVLFCALLAACAGCGSGEVPHGAPLLQKAYWEVGGRQILFWASDSTIAAAPVPAGATQFNLVFDRVLDGSRIEDTVTDGGVSHQQPKTMPPVTVTWPGMPPPDAGVGSGPPFNLDVWYNSVPLIGEGSASSYVFSRGRPTFPSNTLITIHLDKSGLTSHYDEPMVGPESFSVTTEPFALGFGDAAPSSDGSATPLGYRPTNYWLPLDFNNNVPGDVNQLLPQYVQVQREGDSAPLDSSAYRLVPDPGDATRVLLQPARNAIWDSGVRYIVTVAAEFPDVFGSTLGKVSTATFIACEPIGDAGAGAPMCAPAQQGDGGGGVVDAGAVVDAAAEAGAGDAGDAGAAGSDAGAGEADAVGDAPVADVAVTLDAADGGVAVDSAAAPDAPDDLASD
jgi:hypothetical protein